MAAAADVDLVAQLRCDDRGRALLNHLLMAPLNRALALDERNDVSVLIREQLHFDVTWPLETTLEVNRRVAKRTSCFGPGASNRAGQLGLQGHDPHALSTTSGHRLHHQRIADRPRNPDQLPVRNVAGKCLFGSGHNRRASSDRGLAGGGLAAHQRNRLRSRPDERQAGLAAGRGEILVLRQEAVPGMDGVGAGRAGSVDDAVDAEVTLAGRARADGDRRIGHAHMAGRAIAVRIDRHRRNAHLAARANDPDGDLAAVSDQESAQNT